MTNEREERAARAEKMRKTRERSDRRQRNYITIGIVVIVLALIGFGGWAINNASSNNTVSGKYVAPKHTSKDFSIDYTPEIAGGKTTNKTIKVIMYEDFQCPACKAVEQESGAFLRQAVATGDVTLEYRPVSFLDKNSGRFTDNYSHRASNVALCALDSTDVKTFTKLHETLFAAQSPEQGPGLPTSDLERLADQAGASKLTECVNTQRFTPWIDKATKAWADAGYGGTPTILVDGKQVEGAKNAQGQASLARLTDIQKAISAAQAKK